MVKQERTVVHLELKGQHYYYGNLKALCDQWGVEVLGVSYVKLRNYGLSQDNPYVSQNFVIRKGKIITSKREI